MGNEDLISVCIPTYNNSSYIKEMLDSITQQTYRNLEIIISDNASTDNTREIVNAYIEKDKRIQYFCNEENYGFVKNIDIAISYANSEYLALYHSDDLYDHCIIQKEYDILTKNSNIGVVFTKSHKFGLSNSIIDYNKFDLYDNYDKSDNVFIGNHSFYVSRLMRFGNFFVTPSCFMKKSVYYDAGGFDEKYFPAPDLPLWLRILEKKYLIAILNENLVGYRHSETQDSVIFEGREKLPSFYKVADDFLLKYSENDDLYSYNIKKSKDYLRIAKHYSCIGDKEKYQNNINYSLKYHKFKLTSAERAIQTPHNLIVLVVKIIKSIKRRMSVVLK